MKVKYSFLKASRPPVKLIIKSEGILLGQARSDLANRKPCSPIFLVVE
jgi:hypothetical protein